MPPRLPKQLDGGVDAAAGVHGLAWRLLPRRLLGALLHATEARPHELPAARLTTRPCAGLMMEREPTPLAPAGGHDEHSEHGEHCEHALWKVIVRQEAQRLEAYALDEDVYTRTSTGRGSSPKASGTARQNATARRTMSYGRCQWCSTFMPPRQR